MNWYRLTIISAQSVKQMFFFKQKDFNPRHFMQKCWNSSENEKKVAKLFSRVESRESCATQPL